MIGDRVSEGFGDSVSIYIERMEPKILAIIRTVLGALCAVVVLATAYLIGFANGQGEREALYESGYQAAWEEANKRIIAAGLVPDEPTQLLMISGVVSGVSDSTLTMTSDPVSANPLSPQGPEVRLITLTSTTVIVERVNKTPEEISADEIAFSQELSRNPEGSTVDVPIPYTERQISIADIAVGDTILVESTVDIAYATDITASRIVL